MNGIQEARTCEGVQNVNPIIGTGKERAKGKKQCSKCKEIKSVNEFYVNKYHKDGRQSRCKKCLCAIDNAKRNYILPKRWVPGTTPKIGDKINAQELGYKGDDLRIWEVCPLCKTARWMRYGYFKKGMHVLCKSCSKSGSRGPAWKGGRIVNIQGYVHLCLEKTSPYYPMTNGRRGRILEHRLVMAQHTGRCLSTTEIVHHINGIRDDNRIENLELISSKGQHNTHESKKIRELVREIKKLKRIVLDQKKEITILSERKSEKNL